MKYLGISCFGKGSAVALIENGQIKFAVEEERLNREKYTEAPPVNSLKYYLDKFNEKEQHICYPYKFNFFPEAFMMAAHIISHLPGTLQLFRHRLKNNLISYKTFKETRKIIKNKCIGPEFFIRHHTAHASVSFFTSPFKNSAILTADGIGEWPTFQLAYGNNNNIKRLQTINFPHSLGFIYQSFTDYLGFRPNKDEGKVMGLAGYGNDKLVDLFLRMVKLQKTGLKINESFFKFQFGANEWWTSKTKNLLNIPLRNNEKLNPDHCNIAYGVQTLLEKSIFHILNILYEKIKNKNLCLGGGIFLNSLLNGKIKGNTPFENIYIFPASDDAGLAAGAPLYTYYLNNDRSKIHPIKTSSLGPEYSDTFILKSIQKEADKYHYKQVKAIEKEAAKLLAKGKIIGWFQGKMEFGPRAMGYRSILAPAFPKSKKTEINNRVKKREPFRPFAVSILHEKASEYIRNYSESPFMQKIFKVNPQIIQKIPAAIHVDKTVRIQSVKKENNIKLFNLLKEYEKSTKIPLIINTSFNGPGEAIVCSPQDALYLFINSQLEYLIMGNYLLWKK